MRGQEITYLERQQIQLLLRGKWSKRKIGRKLYRNHTIIGREIQRNKDKDGIYWAENAQKKADTRKGKKQKRKMDIDDVLRNWVIAKLQGGWSPEQISGRLKNRPDTFMRGRYICSESLYQYIYQGEGRFLGLYQYLPQKRKKRRKKFSRKYRKNKGISFITPIKYRSKEIDGKEEFGHWESDSMLFSKQKPILSVQRERVSLLTRITKTANKTAQETYDALTRQIELMPQEAFRSITFDRGSEGGDHYRLRMEYDIDTYHCDPYCSWQKGAVENTNMLIRRYLPLKTDLTNVTQEDIYAIQERLNNRPRKTLQFKTPNEAYQEFARCRA